MLWYSRHPDWLARQAYKLSHNSNYRESHQFVGQTLVSCGEVVVRTVPAFRAPVFIVFSTATPYAPPIIVPIRELPDEGHFLQIASGSVAEVMDQLQPEVLMLSVRHQMANGSLCLVGPEETLANRPRLIDVDDAIRRAAAWLAGTRTGHFPPDSPEIELFAHMRRVDAELSILLTGVFDDTKLVEGDFYLTSSKYLPGEGILIGVGLLGRSASGLAQTDLYVRPAEGHLDFFSDVVLDPVKLAEGDVEEMGRQGLVTGKWWTVPVEPFPFGTPEELAALFADPQNALSRIARELEVPIAHADREILVAIRFPDRAGGFEWQFIRLEKPESITVVLLGPVSDSELAERLKQYEVVAIRSERLSREAFFMRNSGRLSDSQLQRQHVVVLGAGALGSEVADCVAKAGVGHLSIVDFDLLHLGNVVRHAAGIESIGQFKSQLVARSAVLHNPFAAVDVGLDATCIDWSAVDSEAVAISTIGDDNTESLVNEMAVFGDRTVYFARALRGGKAARIFRVRPSGDPCMHCLALYQHEGNPLFPVVPDDMSLPAIATECNNPVRPGSGADLKLVAGLASRILLENIQSPGGANHWVWVSEAIEGFPPDTFGSVTAYSLPKHPRCPLCNPTAASPLLVAEEVLALLKSETEASGAVETGGILMGFRVEGDARVAITRATGPGPNAVCEATRFHRDVEYCQEQLDAAATELGRHARYVGEWHYHPAGPALPSGQDLLSLSQIAIQDDYALEMPVMLLVAPDELRATVHPCNRPHAEAEYDSAPLSEILALETEEIGC